MLPICLQRFYRIWGERGCFCVDGQIEQRVRVISFVLDIQMNDPSHSHCSAIMCFWWT